MEGCFKWSIHFISTAFEDRAGRVRSNYFILNFVKMQLDPCTNEEVNFRNALLLRFVFLLFEVGLIDKCHLSYKQKLLGTEEYE